MLFQYTVMQRHEIYGLHKVAAKLTAEALRRLVGLHFVYKKSENEIDMSICLQRQRMFLLFLQDICFSLLKNGLTKTIALPVNTALPQG